MAPITPTLLKNLRPQIEAAINEVLAAHGLIAKTKNISYDEAGFRFPVEVSHMTADGRPADKMGPAFTKYAMSLGLNPSILGQSYTRRNGRTATVMGLRTSARRFPILIEEVGGDRMMVTLEEISRAFPSITA